jgi:hypothetical protein
MADALKARRGKDWDRLQPELAECGRQVITEVNGRAVSDALAGPNIRLVAASVIAPGR